MDFNGCTELMKFDRSNKQVDYMCIAKSVETGKIIEGYVVIDKPWYSPKEAWTYYLMNNSYRSGGFCGGSTDTGLIKTQVDKNTIVPCTQVNRILSKREEGWRVKLMDEVPNGNIICTIKPEGPMPYELWDLIQ